MTKIGGPVLGSYSGSGQDPHERGLRVIKDLKKMARRERKEHGRPHLEKVLGSREHRLNEMIKYRQSLAEKHK
jgi:predicted secreted protein